MRSRLHSLRDRGFTLIELLVVILIIGILAAIALPNFLGQTNRGHDASTKSAIRNSLLTAKTIATDKSGKYPTDLVAQMEDSNEAYTFQAYDAGNPIDGSVKELVTVDRVSQDEVILCNGAIQGRVYCMGSKTQGQYTTAAVESLVATAQAASATTSWGRGATDKTAHDLITNDQGTSTFKSITAADPEPSTPPTVERGITNLQLSRTTADSYPVFSFTYNVAGAAEYVTLCASGVGRYYSNGELFTRHYDIVPNSPGAPVYDDYRERNDSASLTVCPLGGRRLQQQDASGSGEINQLHNGTYQVYAVIRDGQPSNSPAVGTPSNMVTVTVNHPIPSAPEFIDPDGDSVSQSAPIVVRVDPGSDVELVRSFSSTEPGSTLGCGQMSDTDGDGLVTFPPLAEACDFAINGDYEVGDEFTLRAFASKQTNAGYTVIGPKTDRVLTITP